MNFPLMNSPKYLSSASCRTRMASSLSTNRPREIILPRTWICADHFLDFSAHETPVTPDVLFTRIFWFIRFCDFVTSLRLAIRLSSCFPLMWSRSIDGQDPCTYNQARRWAIKLLPYSASPIWRWPCRCRRLATGLPARRVFHPLSMRSNPGRSFRHLHVKLPVSGSYVTSSWRISAVRGVCLDVMGTIHGTPRCAGQSL